MKNRAGKILSEILTVAVSLLAHRLSSLIL